MLSFKENSIAGETDFFVQYIPTKTQNSSVLSDSKLQFLIKSQKINYINSPISLTFHTLTAIIQNIN
jgi:hypothetical protein